MAFEFKLPDVGEGIHEGEIVRWLVSEGDTVAEDQPLVEVQTDKAVVEIPSPVAGIVARLHFKEGDIVPVGHVIVTIETAVETGAGETKTAQRTASGPAAAAKGEPGVHAGTVGAAVDTAPERNGTSRRRVLATPATRRLARELGVDIEQVEGTGPGGRVTDEDVRAFAARLAGTPTPPDHGQPAPPAVTPPVTAAKSEEPGREERIPIRGVRKRIAEQMVKSKFTAPHVTVMEEVDVTELVKVRESALALAEERGIKLTYLPFVMKAVVAALREYPYLNASVDDASQEIVLKRYYNIGIATDTEDGLIVPVVKDVDRKSILQLAAEISALVEKARSRRIALEDLRDGTFTITNVGPFGGLYSTPIINHPEVGILGVHRIRERPVVREGEIVIRQVMGLALSFDHRIVDGAYAARFLNRVMRYLEQPSLLFMELI